MNERIKELLEQAGVKYTIMPKDTVYEKFAELIVRECADVAADHEAFDIYEEIREHFGVEECRGWVCPKCGVDRTKDVCPQGHMAAVEGKCPMIGVAQ